MDELAVHDISVRQQPFFNPNGSVSSQHVVTYFVGPHGPFVLYVKDPDFKASTVQGLIDAKVRELRELRTAFGAGTAAGG